MTQTSAMNGGDGKYSYAKNSTYQRDLIMAVNSDLKEVIEGDQDIASILSDTTTFRIADLGCSVGPNTFFAMQTIIELLENKHHSESLQFQVFFNDQVANDFNTLFNSLPSERRYFVCGVPGSFHNQVFPSSSIHFAYSSTSLHWISKVPKEMQCINSTAWNKGRIHYTGASDAVVKAYADQFEEDMDNFLRARAEEIVRGGLLVIVTMGVHDGQLTHCLGLVITFIGVILMDMAKEGILEEDKIDSLNILNVYPSVKQMTMLVENNACFSIVKIESRVLNTTSNMDVEGTIITIRAVLEGTIASHFGSEVVNEIFDRAMQRKQELADMAYASGVDSIGQLFVVLKRN